MILKHSYEELQALAVEHSNNSQLKITEEQVSGTHTAVPHTFHFPAATSMAENMQPNNHPYVFQDSLEEGTEVWYY